MRFKLLEPKLLDLIQVEICCEMTILQQVEIVISCHIFGQSLLLLCGLLHKYKAYIVELPICFREE